MRTCGAKLPLRGLISVHFEKKQQEYMKKIKDLMLIAVIVFAATFMASLTIKLFINNEASLFEPLYYLVGLSLPIIQLFFEKKFTRNKLILSSIGFPIIMTFVIYLTDIGLI